MSTAGTGVASILSTEAAILNPAASAFFNESSFSYQSYNTKLTNKSKDRLESFPKKNSSMGAFMSDHSGEVKGGLAYLKQDENEFSRERFVLHGAAPMGPTMAVGVSYNYLLDKRPSSYNDRHKVHHQASIGVTKIVDEDTILALVLIDPTRTTPSEERAVGGFQYTVADRFILLGDFGAQFSGNYKKNFLWSGAVQLNIFSDFFLRFGQFYDNITKFKGNGWGLAWIGPRFGAEFGQKFSEQFESGSYVYRNEKIIDTSLSAILKF